MRYLLYVAIWGAQRKHRRHYSPAGRRGSETPRLGGEIFKCNLIVGAHRGCSPAEEFVDKVAAAYAA